VFSQSCTGKAGPWVVDPSAFGMPFERKTAPRFGMTGGRKSVGRFVRSFLRRKSIKEDGALILLGLVECEVCQNSKPRNKREYKPKSNHCMNSQKPIR
jgi:hypothetical protein